MRLKRLDQSVMASRSPLATTGNCGYLEPHELRLVLDDSHKQWWTLKERYHRAQARILGLPSR